LPSAVSRRFVSLYQFAIDQALTASVAKPAASGESIQI
jgi:hypothetical protein